MLHTYKKFLHCLLFVTIESHEYVGLLLRKTNCKLRVMKYLKCVNATKSYQHLQPNYLLKLINSQHHIQQFGECINRVAPKPYCYEITTLSIGLYKHVTQIPIDMTLSSFRNNVKYISNTGLYLWLSSSPKRSYSKGFVLLRLKFFGKKTLFLHFWIEFLNATSDRRFCFGIHTIKFSKYDIFYKNALWGVDSFCFSFSSGQDGNRMSRNPGTVLKCTLCTLT